MMYYNSFPYKMMAVLLALVAVLVPSGAMAYDLVADGIYYNVNEDGTTLSVTYETSSGGSYSGDIVIPDQVTHDGVTREVTAIGDSAFYACQWMTSVSLPSTVTTIEDYGFYACTGLTSIALPEAVTTVGNLAFSFCTGLTSIDFPEAVTSIGDYSFYSCTGLVDLVIPNTVTHLGYGAFVFCDGLQSVVIGSSVDMMWYVFWGCDNLMNVTCLRDLPPYMGLGMNGETHEKVYNFTRQVNEQATLYVPRESVGRYTIANQWRDFKHIVPIGSNPNDMNDDGEVNVADVNAVINAIMMQDATTKHDVNRDGEVNVSDVNAMINTIMGQ